MLQVIYLPDGKNISIDKFLVITDLAELLNFIKFNKIKLLSIPVSIDALDIIDCIVENELHIETIHIQQTMDLLTRLKIFFTIAKAYSEHGIKRNVILSHAYLDSVLEKNNKKD